MLVECMAGKMQEQQTLANLNMMSFLEIRSDDQGLRMIKQGLRTSISI